MENPLKLIIIGFVLLLIGVALPFLMVIQLLEATFFLISVSFACSTAGLVTGFIGIAQYMRFRR